MSVPSRNPPISAPPAGMWQGVAGVLGLEQEQRGAVSLGAGEGSKPGLSGCAGWGLAAALALTQMACPPAWLQLSSTPLHSPVLGQVGKTRTGREGEIGFAPGYAVVSGACFQNWGWRCPAGFPIFVPRLVLCTLLTSLAPAAMTRGIVCCQSGG